MPINGSGWQLLKSGGTSFTYKPAASGEAEFRVDVKDGKKTVVKKTFSVDIVSNTKIKTIAKTDLMSLPQWASKSLGTVGEGTSVEFIANKGCWIKVRYGTKIGYIYNLSTGKFKNYSEITASAINAVADDLIFKNGRTMKELYEYVKALAYAHTDDFGYEENVAYIMRTRRGACYHRASLLCCLLNRAGYETVRVSDGRTKRGPHNWCIVKTAEGWRHIDPTSVLEIGMTYLATDSYMEKAVYWDRTKYPACV